MQITFPLGNICATSGALDALAAAGQSVQELLSRHARLDWGEVDATDWKTNDLALTQGLRVISSYTTHNAQLIWVITEADRSVTTLLVPDEYQRNTI